MNRAILFGFALLATACGNSKTFDSLCANQVPPPEACNLPCDPAPGATNACPTGYHCSADGKCDLLCTQNGDECGDGYACTADGYCVNDGNGSGGPPVDSNCPAVHLTATKTTPSIQLLIDRSGSMLEDFGSTKKYLAVQEALIGATGVVARLQSQAYFGASMYPSNACPAILSIGRALDNEPGIDQFLKANPPAPQGSGSVRNTPTPTSIKAVVDDFKAHTPPAGSPPVIVLATDGLPNTCDSSTSTQTQSIAEATAAYQAGIKLYVLSVGTISGAATHLQNLANAGLGVGPGQPNAKVFIGNNPAELAAAFEQLIGGVLSCDLQLDGRVESGDAPSGTVTLNDMPLVYGTDWTVDGNGVTLRLLGNACTALRNATSPTVDASFPCGTVIL